MLSVVLLAAAFTVPADAGCTPAARVGRAPGLRPGSQPGQNLTFTPAPLRPLSLRDVGVQPIDVRPGRYLIGADPASRAVFFFEPRRATVFRVSADTGRTLEMTLENVPEYANNSAAVQQGAYAGERGRSLIPALWRGGAGVFVFSSQGRYLQTIRLVPTVEIRRIAPGPGGGFYALGIDPASRPDRRLLVHEYTAQGRRTTAFSECPPASAPAEAKQGMLWIQGGLVYHVLPAAKRLRVFDASGKTLRDVAIECPPGAPASIQIVVPLTAGRFLVEWAAAGTYIASRYLSLHDENGLAISAATPEPARSAVIFADSAGICYRLRYTPAGRQEIVRTIPAQ